MTILPSITAQAGLQTIAVPGGGRWSDADLLLHLCNRCQFSAVNTMAWRV